MNLDRISSGLSRAGLNLFAVIDKSSLSKIADLDHWDSLILIGNAGPAMWRTLPSEYLNRSDPVDSYSRDAVVNLLEKHAQGVSWELLFPNGNGNCPPLQSLGKQAGWHADSPLGLGIDQRWGLWFAYRAVVGVAAELEPVLSPVTESPCLSCHSQDCVAACPGQAITFAEPPELSRCARYRLRPASKCAETCIARLRCPVAPECRYDEAQMAYHYRQALPALAQWLDQ